ncbi:1-phosphatidylinositol 4,5-bisphosphate phosphodiesterase delta-1-like isoform X2 [Dreissena polymorpha]|uniref:1-phosphatidylinositol 4,5-bisphosphate phosphodiesterase delta-1-like isoform X2 n=1 Tax=Dreissena polymorpha TaxID=45954 RepID=UPI0022655B0F|nr:1-phosphatidylinositol 4,5-bisphosphate phosphodiesterase delta-1-like isoform X2 [Dreissena polymorpha]
MACLGRRNSNLKQRNKSKVSSKQEGYTSPWATGGQNAAKGNECPKHSLVLTHLYNDGVSIIKNERVYQCPTVNLHCIHLLCYMDDLLHELSAGDDLNKIKGGGILYTRHFCLDSKSLRLYYTGSEKRFRKKNTSWPLSSIEEVREGEKDYAKRLDHHDRCKAFCVVFGSNHEVLYLLAHSYEIRDKWVRGLRYALQLNTFLKQSESDTIWICEAFDRADKNSDNSLDFEEVMKLLKSLNADMDSSYVKEMFNAADTRKIKGEKASLDRDEFVQFYKRLTERPEIEELYMIYAKDVGYMTASDLQMFLTQEQKEKDIGLDRCKEIMVVYEPHKEMKHNNRLSLIGFRSFLVSQQQHLFNRLHRRVYQDMTQPMTNYFINSSHNTYLAEDQLKGPSRVECYISALKQGCRCVELDCWDGNDGEPVIYHGYTFTSKILFIDVINAIKDYAFVTSPYPVTLSIENHCSIEQQTKMANYMTRIFGDMLYCPHNMPDVTPSPHELKNKILVKGKKFKAQTSGDDEDEVTDEDESAEANQDQVKTKQAEAKLHLSSELSNTVTMKSVAFKGLQDIPTGNGNFNVVSLVEKKIQKLIDSEIESVCKYTQSALIRTYPAGTRTDSSNYNPVAMWSGGCQVVALNFQTGGEEMQLLHGKFLDNGNSGYVLKPQCLMGDNFEALVGNRPSSTRKRLTIKVLSGFQLPKPKDSKKGEVIDPFIKIEIHGLQRDTQDKKTSVVKNNGFKPIWNETLMFEVDVPELALARLTVWDSDRYVDDFIGYFVVPVNSIVEGYRHFPLFDKNGDQYEQALVFVHVTKEDIPHSRHTH